MEAEAFATTPGTGAGVVDLKKEEGRKLQSARSPGGAAPLKAGGMLLYVAIGACRAVVRACVRERRWRMCGALIMEAD